MSKLINTLFLLTSMLLLGCSGPSGETPAKFKIALGAMGTSNFPGGLVVYGVSQDRAFGRVLTTESVDEFIPNGTWNFYALAWESADPALPEDMTGTVKCAFQGGVVLNGAPVEIDLTVMNSTCQGNLFASGVNTNTNGDFEFQNFELKSCNQKGVNDIASAAYSDADCSYDPLHATPKNEKGYALSYKVMLKAYNRAGSNINLLNPQLESACIVVDAADINGATAASNTMLNNLNIPAGAANGPFATVIRAYFTNDCDASLQKGFKDILLPNGIAGQSFHHKHFLPPTSTSAHKLFVRVDEVDTCKAPRLSVMGTLGSNTNIFAAGTGSIQSPYVICSAAQLNSIGQDSSYASKSFILGQDIDLHPFRKALNPNGAPPCTDGGDNFYPLDGYANPTGCDDSLGTASAYSGVFDGNNKVIKNLQINKDKLNKVGFIRTMQSNGSLINIKFENPEFIGNSMVGIIAHSNVSGTAAQNIHITKGLFISEDQVSGGGGSKVGAIVGDLSGGTIKNVIADRAKVETMNPYAGGIVGLMSGGSILKAKFDGEVISHRSEAHSLGGIVGKVNNSTALEELVFSGAILTRSHNSGGIVGAMYGASNSSFKNIISRGLINQISPPTQQNYNMGGLIGLLDTSAEITNSINYAIMNGVLKQNCGSGSNCKIGATVGNHQSVTITIPTTFYRNFNYVSLGGNNGPEAGNDYDFLVTAGNTGIGDIINGTAAGQFSESGNLGKWKIMTHNNSHPRLAFEPAHPCDEVANLASISNQISSGRGSATNPIRLCTRSQLANIPNNSSHHYRLEENIYLGGNFTMASNFGGSIDGNGRMILSYSFNPVANTNTGLLKNTTSSAMIKNLKVYGVNIGNIANSVGYYSGMLVGSNLGSIKNVDIIGVSTAQKNIGGLVGYNNGLVEDVIVQVGLSNGPLRNAAGVAVINAANGTIKKAKVQANLTNTANGYTSLAGVTVDNAGLIDQVQFSGVIHAGLNTSDGNNANMSFIASSNDGTIRNVLVTEYAELFSDSNSNDVAGLAVTNTGTIENSLVQGKIFHSGLSSSPSNVDILIGDNTNGTSTRNKFLVPVIEEWTDPESLGALTMTYTTPTGLSQCNITIPFASLPINDGQDLSLKFVRLTDNSNKTIFGYVVEDQVGGAILPLSAANYTLKLYGACLDSNDFNYTSIQTMNIFTPQSNIPGGQIYLSDLGNLENYCEDDPLPNTTEGRNAFACQAGWDIVGKATPSSNDYYGFTRVLGYFSAVLSGTNPPSNSPIWEMREKFPYNPQLIQVRD